MIGWVARRLDWSGTAKRSELWVVVLLWLAALFIWAFLRQFTGQISGNVRYGFPVAAIFFVLLVSTLMRRLHDIGRSGGWAWAIVVPLLSPIVLFYGLFARSRPDAPNWRSASLSRRIGQGGVGLFALLLASRAVWAPYWIAAASMSPTLIPGDYVIAMAVSANAVERGDVLVFRHPARQVDFVKRLIGLPGDTVQMIDGNLWLNGQPVPQETIGRFEEIKAPQGPQGNVPICANDPVEMGGACFTDRSFETLSNGTRYEVLNIATTLSDNTPVFTVPAGHYFFLGDNRDNSHDSRFVQKTGGLGMVPTNNVKARIIRVVYSTSGASKYDFASARGNRWWKQIE